MKTQGFWVIGLVALAAVGCRDTVESTDIRTSGVYPDMAVTSTGDGSARAEVHLTVGGPTGTDMELKSPDKLVVTAGKSEVTLTKSGVFYQGDINVDAAGTEFVFAFDRGANDDSASDSRVTMPEAFDLAGVTSKTIVSRSKSVTVTWTKAKAPKSDDEMSYKVDGDCLFMKTGSVDDVGALLLDSGKVDATSSGAKETCLVKLCVDRLRHGTRDAKFTEGGKVRAIQHRCIEFQSAP